MGMAIDQLKSELNELSLQERAELAQFLIQTLDIEADAGIEESWDSELARRSDEISSGQVVGRPAEQVFAEIRARRS